MKTTLLLLIICLSKQFKAQQGFVAVGGNLSSTSGSVSYSVGQVSDRNLISTSSSINEGLQQPIEYYVLAIGEINTKIDVKIFPNPTINYLNIEVSNGKNDLINCELFDLQGRLIKNQSTNQQKIKIDLQDLPIQTYLLKISINNSIINTYKIIKN